MNHVTSLVCTFLSLALPPQKTYFIFTGLCIHSLPIFIIIILADNKLLKCLLYARNCTNECTVHSSVLSYNPKILWNECFTDEERGFKGSNNFPQIIHLANKSESELVKTPKSHPPSVLWDAVFPYIINLCILACCSLSGM